MRNNKMDQAMIKNNFPPATGCVRIEIKTETYFFLDSRFHGNDREHRGNR